MVTVGCLRARVFPPLALLSALFLLLLVQTASGEDDSACLHSVFGSFIDPSGYLSTWRFENTTPGSVCDFIGVQCWHSGENKVFSIRISGASLGGSFPKGLNACSSLQQLDLSDNNLTGLLPDDLCTSEGKYLTKMDLSSNAFTGPLPPSIGNCLYLNQLHIQSNRLNGSIPAQIGLLPRLTDLNLANNLFSGVVPGNLQNWTSAFEGNPGLCGNPLAACSSPGSNSKLVIAVSSSVIAAVSVLLLIIAVAVYRFYGSSRRKRRAMLRDEDRWAARIKAPRSVTVTMFEKPLVKMRLSDLMSATGGFSKDNIIGTGRTGTVYKATLADGSLLAIKRLCGSDRSEKEFRSEMGTLGQLRHRNLVPLLGYCVAGQEKLLVYKHMVNGSLKLRLHDDSNSNEARMDWPDRLKIAIGAARGLAWLHHSCNPRVIHRNISASSILLDEEYEPRITDFGLARLMNPVDTHVSTFVNGDFGDVGYVAPEYIRTLVATMKGDVYSFGVVLLELITSQKAVEVCASGDFKGNLAEWITFLSSNGRVQEAIDPSLKGNGGHNDELVQFIRIACTCISSSPKDRPTTYEIYQMLRSVGQKYNFTDQYDELPITIVTRDTDSNMDELIVARESRE